LREESIFFHLGLNFVLLWNLLDFTDLQIGFGLWYLMPLSTIFQLYRGSQFYWWRKPEYLEKNPQPTESHSQTLSHNVVLSTPCLIGLRTHNLSGDRHWLHGWL